VLRVLGVHPGPSAGLDSVAALAGIPRPAARDAVAALAAAGLVETVAGRVVVPAGLRDAAAGRPDAAAARQRLLHHLLTRAVAAAAVAAPGGPAVVLPPFNCAAAARIWLAVEQPTLLAVPDPEFALRLAPALAEHLADTDRLVLLRRALAAGGGGPVRMRLGVVLCRLGRAAEAAEQLRAALPELADPAERAAGLLHLARCRERQGRRIEALGWYAEAYEACLHAGDQLGRDVAGRALATG
jgi:tetratricopeptide (TPR) repeat protein